MMIMATAPTKFFPQVYQHDTETTTLEDMIDPHLGVTIAIGITTVTIEIDTGSADLNLTPIIPRYRSNSHSDSCKKSTLDPFTDPHAAAHHTTEA